MKKSEEIQGDIFKQEPHHVEFEEEELVRKHLDKKTYVDIQIDLNCMLFRLVRGGRVKMIAGASSVENLMDLFSVHPVVLNGEELGDKQSKEFWNKLKKS